MALAFKMPSSTVVSNLPGQPFNVSSLQRFNVLLLGSGGREAALAWKIAQSPLLDHLYIAPGNGGTEAFGENVPLSVNDFSGIEQFASDRGINLIVVGPEDPLVNGIADYFAGKVPVVGPMKAGAMLEGSKDFAKGFMKRHNIPTARYKSFKKGEERQADEFLTSLKPPYVLKADGLAAGKGVLIVDDLEQAKKDMRQMLSGMFGTASETLVIEEYLDGIECSVFVLTDGSGNYRILPVAKDYKRIYDGDKGPNTGGMGSVSPVPFADESFMEKVAKQIIEPTLKGLQEEGIIYRGFIFLGLMNAGGEPKVIEYNVRMGDPETQAVMPRIESDLLNLMVAAAHGDLAGHDLKIKPEHCAVVVGVSEGYPGKYEKGKPMEISDNIAKDTFLFHAGTTRNGQELLTSGGRVIAVSSVAPSLAEAVAQSYREMDKIHFPGLTYRHDIGHEFI